MKIKLPVLVGLLAGVVALITFYLTQFHAAIEISMNSAWGELNDKPHVARITLHNTGHLAVYDCRVDYYVGPKTERRLSVSDYREYESKADKGTQTVPSLEPAHSMVWDFLFTPKVKPYFGLASATCRYETLLDRQLCPVDKPGVGSNVVLGSYAPACNDQNSGLKRAARHGSCLG